MGRGAMGNAKSHLLLLLGFLALAVVCAAASYKFGEKTAPWPELRVAQAEPGSEEEYAEEEEAEEEEYYYEEEEEGPMAAPAAAAPAAPLPAAAIPFHPGLGTPGGPPEWTLSEEDQRRIQWSREVAARWEALEEYEDRMMGISDGTTTLMLGWPQALPRWALLYGWYGRHVDAQTRAAMHELLDPVADEIAWAYRGTWSPVPTASLSMLFGGGGLGSSVVVGPDSTAAGAGAAPAEAEEEGGVPAGAGQPAAGETVSAPPPQAAGEEEYYAEEEEGAAEEEEGAAPAAGAPTAAAGPGGVVAAAGDPQSALCVREMYAISATGQCAGDGKIIPFCGPTTATAGYIDKEGRYVLQTTLAGLQEMIRRGIKRKIRLMARADALADRKNIPKEIDDKLWECARATVARETRLNPATDPARWAQRVREEYEDLVVLYKYGVKACPWFDAKSRPKLVHLGG